MYKIETFIRNFGREDFYKRFTEYKDACDILEEADGGFFTIEEEIYSAYETKKMYHNYFNSIEKLEDVMKKFINDIDISDLLISTEKELFSSIKKYYDSLTPDSVESIKLTSKTYEEIKSLISSIMEFKNSFKNYNDNEICTENLKETSIEKVIESFKKEGKNILYTGISGKSPHEPIEGSLNHSDVIVLKTKDELYLYHWNSIHKEYYIIYRGVCL